MNLAESILQFLFVVTIRILVLIFLFTGLNNIQKLIIMFYRPNRPSITMVCQILHICHFRCIMQKYNTLKHTVKGQVLMASYYSKVSSQKI